MDYSLITETQIREKFSKLPESIQDILQSETAMKTVHQIARGHFLDAEREEMLIQLTALTLMGFVPVRDLTSEIEENFLINYRHASMLARDLTTRIFSRVPDFEEVQPDLEETPTKINAEEGVIRPEKEPAPTPAEPLLSPPKPEIKGVAVTPAAPPARPVPPPPPSGKPFDTAQGAAQDKPTETKSGQAPFMLYQTEKQNPLSESFRAKISSEFSTAPLKPAAAPAAARLEMGGGSGAPPVLEEVVDLETFEKIKKPFGAAQDKPATEPKVNGNTLDLRN